LPALYQLHCLGYLAGDVKILGCGRTPHQPDAWRDEVRKVLSPGSSDACLDGFLQRLDYLAGSLEDAGFYQALGAGSVTANAPEM